MQLARSGHWEHYSGHYSGRCKNGGFGTVDVKLIGKDKYLTLLNDLTTTVPKPPVFNVHYNDHCTVS